MALDGTQVTDNWLVAMARADCEPVILLTIDIDGSTQYKFVSHTGTGLGYDASLASVSNVAAQIDPVERTFRIGTVLMEFVDDSAVRDVIVNNRMRGKRCILELGEATLAEADYAPYFRGIFTDWRGEGSSIVLEAKDAYDICANTIEYDRQWKLKHPLEVIKDILDNVALVPSELIDATSLDPDSYSTDFSHWAVSGNVGQNKTFPYPPPVIKSKELIDQLAALCHGGLYPDEEGKLSFYRFDSGASADASWTADDWTDLEVVDTNANIVNRAYMQTNSDSPHRKEWTEGSYPKPKSVWQMPAVSYTNDDSVSNFAFPGAASQVFAHQFHTPWVFGYSLISGTQTNDVFDTNDTTCKINVNGQAIAGLRDDGSTHFELSAARPAYLLFHEINHPVRGTHFEVVKMSASNVASVTDELTEDGDARIVTFTVATNGRKATDATPAATGDQDFDKGYTRVWDVTTCIDRLQRVIDRQSEGIPVIKVRTNLSQYAVQIGDLVTIAGATSYVNFGQDGLSGSTKWEVVGKEPDPLGDTPGIKWTLARASVESGYNDTWSPTTATGKPKAEEIGPGPGFDDILDGWHNGGFGDIIREGLNVTDATGLDIDIAPGVGGTKTGLVRYNGASGVTLADDSTSWVYFNPGNQKVETSTNAIEVEEGSVLLAKVVTASGDITGITDYRNAYTGTAKPESIGGANGSALNSSLSLRTRDYWLPDFFEYDAEASTGTYGTDISVGTNNLKTGANTIRFAASANKPVFRSGFYPVTQGRLYRVTFASEVGNIGVQPSVSVNWYQEDKVTLVSTSTLFAKALDAATTYETHSIQTLAPANARFARLRIGKNNTNANTIDWDVIRFDVCPTYAKAWRSGSNQNINNNNWTLVQLNSETDPANSFDNSNYYWQAPMDGLVDISAAVTFDVSSSAAIYQCALYEDSAPGYSGAAVAALGSTTQSEASNEDLTSVVSVVGYGVNAGDRIYLYCRTPDEPAVVNYNVLLGATNTYMYVRQVDPLL